ncbi:TPA: DUF6290 family protein, partial [Streptococcus suis]
MGTIAPVSFRLEQDLIDALNEASAITNLSKTDIVRDAITEKLEDMYDIAMADKAYQKWVEGG